MADTDPSGRAESSLDPSTPRHASSDAVADDREHPSPDRRPAQTPSGFHVRGERVWASVGKIGTLVGLLIGLFTLAKLLWAPGARIAADCQIVGSAVPPPSVMLGQFPSRIQAALSPKSIEAALSGTHLTSNWTAAQRAEAAEVVRAYLYVPGLAKVDDFGAASDLLQCGITNSGGEPAHEVVFDLATTPSIVMVNSTNLPLTEGQRSVPLGVVRPSVDIDLRVWFPIGQVWGQDQFQISHQTGVGKVALLDLRRGFPGPVARFVIFWGQLPLWSTGPVAIVLVLLIIRVWLGIRSRTGTKLSQG